MNSERTQLKLWQHQILLHGVVASSTPATMPAEQLSSQPRQPSTWPNFWIADTETCQSQCSCLCKFFVEVWHVWGKLHKFKGPINFSKVNMHVYSLPKPRWEIDLVPEACLKPPSVTYFLPRWHSSDFYLPRFCEPLFWTWYK